MGHLLRQPQVGRLRPLIKAARQSVFPDQCPQCGALVEGQGGLCGSCWRETPFLSGLVCDLCGVEQIGPDNGTPCVCDACVAHARPWRRGRSVLAYIGGARRMVLALKHGDRTDLVPTLGRWMAERAGPVVGPQTVLVPVPLHRRRLVRRRYNQAALLAHAMARHLGCVCLPDALIRVRATAPLAKGAYAERAAELDEAIVANPRAEGLAGRPVCLVDDVMTSGATLAACTEAALASGARDVTVMTLARAHQ